MAVRARSLVVLFAICGAVKVHAQVARDVNVVIDARDSLRNPVPGVDITFARG